ncbi:MAG TPA: hypothetical protein DD381_04960 [Lentisphaeria bacterium]|nr:MAG: hypothetical protein A2X47_01870 [Lentisphaerae bacterium GWF2_38_69]HBM15680.1 hypothetical protein [Lentisphaeria bacterium]
MLKKYFHLSTIILTLSITSCQSSLPPGNPPDGPIVTIENNNNAILNESTAVEKMVTALATSDPIINAYPIAHIIQGRSNAQIEYSAQASALSSKVLRELIATGVANCGTGNSSDPELELTSSFVKLQTMENGNIVFKWIIDITRKGMSDKLYSYGLKIEIVPINTSVSNIKPEEITPVYK